MGTIWDKQIEEMFGTPPKTLLAPIDLRDDDRDGVCGELVMFWEKWLNSSLPIALIDLTSYKDAEDYFKKGFNSTAQNRTRYAERKGYTCRIMDLKERNTRLDELHAINTSKDVRQGNPMRQNYIDYPQPIVEPKESCDLHFRKWYGAFAPNGTWIGYIVGVFAGELAAAGQILGNGNCAKDDFMYLLWKFFVEDVISENIQLKCIIRNDVKYIIYSRWGDGGEGLRYWKHSVGMVPTKYHYHRVTTM